MIPKYDLNGLIQQFLRLTDVAWSAVKRAASPQLHRLHRVYTIRIENGVSIRSVIEKTERKGEK